MSHMRRTRRTQSGITNRYSISESTLNASRSTRSLHLPRPRTVEGMSMNRVQSMPHLRQLRKKKAQGIKNIVSKRRHTKLGCPEDEIPQGQKSVLEALIENISRNLQQRYTGKGSLRKVFLAWDANRDGVVDPTELEEIFQKCGCMINAQQAKDICRHFGDEKARIPYDGFLDLIFKDTAAAPVVKRDVVKELRSRLRELGVSESEIENAARPPDHVLPIEEVIKRLKKKFQAKRSLAAEFRKIDDDKNGTVSVDELHNFLNRQGLLSRRADIEEMFNRFDESHDGCVDYLEFTSLVFPEEDRGGFIRLTPREEDTTASNTADSLDAEILKKKSMLERRDSFSRVVTDDISDALDGDVKEAVIMARIRNNVALKISENFSNLSTAFAAMDENGDGMISYAEFRAACKDLNLNLSNEHADIFMSYIDQDGSGSIEFSEFQRTIESRFGISMSDGNNGEAGKKADNLSKATKAGFGGTQLSGLTPEEKEELRNSQKAGNSGLSKSIREKKPDHETKNMKTATSCNIGLAASNRIPNNQMIARKALKRRLFPVNSRPRPRTEPGAVRGIDGRSKFSFEDLEQKRQVVTRGSNTRPTKGTQYLIRPTPEMEEQMRGIYTYEKGKQFQVESYRSYSLNEKAAYWAQPEQVRKRERYLNKLQAKRETKERMQMLSQRPRTTHEDPDRRLKTVIKHQLNYYTRLHALNEKEKVRRQKAGW